MKRDQRTDKNSLETLTAEKKHDSAIITFTFLGWRADVFSQSHQSEKRLAF
jgi:hypothetical protein